MFWKSRSLGCVRGLARGSLLIILVSSSLNAIAADPLGSNATLNTLRPQRSLLQRDGPKPKEEGSCALVKSLPHGSDLCAYVEAHCHTDAKLPYFKVYFCYVRGAGFWASAAMQLGCLIFLLLLFCLLGSTAEHFFSPILTQISQDLGLPPRLAGVTFLALGNGAPDISASIAAVKMGAYPLALAGLLGGGMFVGCAVSGAVILVGNGAKAQGALMRDVMAYLLSLVTVVGILLSGRFTWPAAGGLLCMYIGFVAIVFCADMYHIASTRHGSHRQKPEHVPLLEGEPGSSLASHKPPVAEYYPPPEVARTVRGEVEMTESPETSVDSDLRGYRENQSAGAGPSVFLDDLQHKLSYEERVHLTAREYLERGLMEQEAVDDGSCDEEELVARHSALTSGALGLHHHADRGYCPPQVQSQESAAPASRGPSGDHVGVGEAGWPKGRERADPEGAGPDMERGRSLPGGDQEVSSQSGWREEESREPMLFEKAAEKFWWLSAFFTVLEYPFVLLRRATILLVEAEGYSRPWFLVSLVGAPLAVCAYLELPWAAYIIGGGAGGLAALCFGLLLPEDTEPPFWGCGTGYPIGATLMAVGGFVVAAMWIDTIASELVGLLDYFGVLLGLDHAVLGLTILAWGNSIGDMVTNIAIARRGLPNMAITACFAGPVFNLLISLGVGFMLLIGRDRTPPIPVRLSPLDAIGAGFLITMCLAVIVTGLVNNRRLPQRSGLMLIGLYAAYLISSVLYVASGGS